MAFKGNFTVDMCIDCSNVTASDDLDWAPNGTTAHSHSMGWCYSELDDDIGCTASPGDCWAMCEDAYGDDLVAIDWEDGECYCQNDCQCMEDVGEDETYLITRDSFAALPHECGYSYPSGSCGDHAWGADRDGHLKCGEGREPYPEGDAALHAMGDDAETCCPTGHDDGTDICAILWDHGLGPEYALSLIHI